MHVNLTAGQLDYQEIEADLNSNRSLNLSLQPLFSPKKGFGVL
jgi:hypothetical protein